MKNVSCKISSFTLNYRVNMEFFWKGLLKAKSEDSCFYGGETSYKKALIIIIDRQGYNDSG